MILLYRFYGNKTQTEIAELMNLSQMHVSRLITRTLAAVQAELLKVHGCEVARTVVSTAAGKRGAETGESP